jgi:hypothetical protein
MNIVTDLSGSIIVWQIMNFILLLNSTHVPVLKVFENRVLRRIFGPKREEVVGSKRRLHNEELRNLYTPPNIIRVIKSRRMG